MADTAGRFNYVFTVMHRAAGKVFSIREEKDFEERALEIFRFQALNNPVYAQWLKEVGVEYRRVAGLDDIPFLPVSAFNKHEVLISDYSAEKIFVSSGTTGTRKSRHYVADTGIYEESLSACFRIFYGEPSDYVILALLPSYLERDDSSLVYMAGALIRLSASPLSGFFLDDYHSLEERITEAKKGKKKIILLGVSFALLDFAAHSDISLDGHIVMETGGMKGRKKEMTREELHSILGSSFKLDLIHSEYGMTELLSQAYSQGGGIYHCPPWMKILIRDPYDPFAFLGFERTGGVNIIDLANIYSCSFLETSDLGIAHADGSFEIRGRFDNSDIRGCNLMV